MQITDDEIAKLIAENLPSPYSRDIVWRQTLGAPTFDLSDDFAGPEAAEEWRSLARIVRAALAPS